jgi:hypothetical protein
MEVLLMDLEYIEYDRTAMAYHEAARLVIGLTNGWWAGADGINIREPAFAQLRAAFEDATAEARLMVAMAGWFAEFNWYDRKARGADSNPRTFDSHHRDVPFAGAEVRYLSGIVQDQNFSEPETTADRILSRVKDCRERTAALLEHPLIWDTVERTVAFLLARDRISQDEFEELLGDDFDKLSFVAYDAKRKLRIMH